MRYSEAFLGGIIGRRNWEAAACMDITSGDRGVGGALIRSDKLSHSEVRCRVGGWSSSGDNKTYHKRLSSKAVSLSDGEIT